MGDVRLERLLAVVSLFGQLAELPLEHISLFTGFGPETCQGFSR